MNTFIYLLSKSWTFERTKENKYNFFVNSHITQNHPIFNLYGPKTIEQENVVKFEDQG